MGGGIAAMEIAYHPQNEAVVRLLAGQDFDSKVWFQLRSAAERLSLLDGFDRLVSLESLRISLFRHQEQAVLKVLKEMRGRAVLADEVGLGKTIEAGVILKEYVLRSLVQRVLILTPASLVSQWRDELQQKLALEFAVVRTPRDLERAFRVIASLDIAKRPANRDAVQQIAWDMVIVDEAHRLKNERTLNWQLVNGLQKKYLLLLTATPVQNDLRELYNLITLLKPGQLKTFSQFKRTYMLDRRSPKNTLRLREALREVMVRTTRRETLIPFPRRKVHSVAVPMGQEERRCYDELLAILRRAYKAMPKDKKNLLPLLLVLRESCSHPRAALVTLEGMSRRRTIEGLSAEVLERWRSSVRELLPAKLGTMIRQVERWGGECVVFTEFRGSQREIARALEQAGLPVHVFHGGLSDQEKERVIGRFRTSGGVLVSTDAGSEGRNLQFCRCVINYDLPWNPMRVEQRIGRVHRLGQDREVEIVNLVTEGTVDAYVLYLLEKKLDMFHKVIGELDAVLASLEGGFEERVGHAVLESDTPEELAARVEAFGQEIERAWGAYERVRRLNEELFG